MNEVHQLNLQDNLIAMEHSEDVSSLYGSGKVISDYYISRGQLPSIPDFDGIIDSSFIKKISESK